MSKAASSASALTPASAGSPRSSARRSPPSVAACRDIRASSSCAPALPSAGTSTRRGRFREHRAVLALDVGAHARGIDVEAGDRIGQRDQAAVRHQEQCGPLGQLGLPFAQAALVRRRHRCEQRGSVVRRSCRGGDRGHRRDRVALVRHCRRSAALRARRLGDFADLALGEQGQVVADLAERAAQERELAGERDRAVALDMPGAFRLAQIELRGKTSRHRRPLVAEQGQRADGAAELQSQCRSPRSRQAIARTQQRRDPGDDLEAEADHLRRLHQRAREHRCGDVRARQRQQRAGQAAEIDGDQVEGAPRRQHHRAVDDVLAGAAEVDEAGGGRIALGDARGQPLDERNREAARGPGVGDERVDVERRGARRRDRGSRLGGDHALGGLGLGQRRLEREHRLDQRPIGEDVDHRRTGQRALEQRGAHRRRVIRRRPPHASPARARGRWRGPCRRACRRGRRPRSASLPTRPSRPRRAGGRGAA